MEGKTFKCNLCSQEFSSSYKLNVHAKRQHKGASVRKLKNLQQCNLCGCEFSDGTYLRNHMMIHTGERPFKCTIDACEMTFKHKSTLEDHIKFKHSNARPFQCDFPGCLFTAKKASNLRAHKKTHSCIERSFACPHNGCSFRAKWKSSLKPHEKFVHSESKAFACTKCDYKTTRRSILMRHMRRHSSRRDFKCNHPDCTESYKSSTALKYHFTNQHGEKNMDCDQPGCGRKFGNALAFRNHKRNVHGKKIHACPNLNCNYRAQLASNLAKHMIAHDGRNERIRCSMEGCEYKGKNSRAVKAHMSRHETLLKCPVSGCGRYACSEGALENHQKLHNPFGRPFQCPLCFKCFSKRVQLDCHALVHTKEKPFRCGHCEYATSVKGSVRTLGVTSLLYIRT